MPEPASAPFTVPANATPAPLYDAFATIAEGKVIKKAVPAYPETAKIRGMEGTVLVDTIIGTDGKPTQVVAVRGPEPLYKSSIDAVRAWVYTPFTVDGKPVKAELLLNVVYALGR